MTGAQLDKFLEIKKLQDKKFSKKTFADGLGITRQNLNSKFTSKSLDSEFVKQVADYFKMTVPELENFSKDITGIVNEPPGNYGTISLQDKYNRCLDDKAELLDKLTSARETINELKRKIWTLEQRK